MPAKILTLGVLSNWISPYRDATRLLNRGAHDKAVRTLLGSNQSHKRPDNRPIGRSEILVRLGRI